MKKRILSLVLALALVLTGVPMTFAATSGFSANAPQTQENTTGPLKMAVDTVEETVPASGLSSQAVAEGEEKIVHDASGRFSLKVEEEAPADTDVVNFIVELKGEPLLAAGFSADEIAAQSASVTNYQDKQLVNINGLKTRLTNRFGSDENFKINYTYTVATNGLSVTTAYGNKAAIEAMPGVERVYLSPTFQLPDDYKLDTGDVYQPSTGNATGMIGADVLNESGYTGKGMKVAILDTGIVVDHPSFGALPEDKLTEDSMTRESVEAVWDTLNASQTNLLNRSYYNSKLPFVFNYFSMNFDVSHTGTAQSDHGTHVAGIVAANQVEGVDVIGVVPDAQLVIMQVFTNTGGAEWDTVMAALEDCIRLDVDAANLSLGSAAGFTQSEDDVYRVLELFTETDIEVVIAAGNDTNNAYMNLTGLDMSLASNPDTGLAGTPSTYFPALSVASVDNDGSELPYFTVGGRNIGFYDTATSSATRFLSNFQGKTLEFVAVPGYGKPEDYAGLDVTGKVALVSRGDTSFPEKQTAAQDAGAIACVVYNNVLGPIRMQINDGTGHIPCVSISMGDGQYLKELATGSMTVCTGQLIQIKEPRMISSFSSWGVTPDLKLKPEIAGVGGNIYSSTDPAISGTNYGIMGGTSMATPQISGALAVMMSYLRENYDYSEVEVRRIATNLLMSTADPVMVNDTLEETPRAQGSGLANLVEATTTQAYLTSRDTYENRPKGEFGDDPERTGVYTFNFEINNMSGDQDLSYSFDGSVFTETLYQDAYIANEPYALEGGVTVYQAVATEVLKYDFTQDGEITTADARALLRYVHGVQSLDEVHLPYTDVNGDGVTDKADVDLITAYCAELEVDVDLLAKVEVLGQEAVEAVTVPAGETMTLTARIQLTEADKQYIAASFPNGMYVEGFLYVNSTDEDGVNLQMPFVGFYGDWSDAPIFDEPENPSLYPRAVFTNYSQIGVNPYLSYGAGGDQYNAFSYANPLAEIDFGMLRNAKKMSFTVTDKETGEVYFELSGDNLAKSYFNSNYGMIYPFWILASDGEVWNGLDLEGNKLPDGTQVTYLVEAWVDDGDDIMDDSFSFDVTLDDKVPELLNAYELQDALTFADGRTYLTLDLQDNHYIAAVLFVDPNGTIMGKFAVDNQPGETYTETYDITGFGTDFTIVVADYACNELEVDAVLDLGDYVEQPTLKDLSQDRLYGCENFNGASIDMGWFSANKADMSDVRNETFDSTSYYSAEYVNGYLVAQNAATCDLVLVTPNNTFWSTSTLVNQSGVEGDPGVWVLYDMALDYSDKGKGQYDTKSNNLYAVGWMYEGDGDGDGVDDGSNMLFRIVFYDNGYIEVERIAEITGTSGDELVTLGCTTEGQLYGIDTDGNFYSVERDGVCSYIGTTDFVNKPNYSGVNVIQSMGYDHNTDTMYWYAHSQTAAGNTYVNVCMTYTIDLATGRCTEVGSYGVGGQTGLFVPTDLESDLFTIGVDPTGFSVSPYSQTMAQGQSKRLSVNWQPWNAKGTTVTWTSSDETVATVNASGLVTAVGPGEATITATAQVWNQWGNPAGWQENSGTCQLRVVNSNAGIYGFVVEDYINADNNRSWLTFSDQQPGRTTQIAKQYVDYTGTDGTQITDLALWQGGAYYNGYVYTVGMDQRIDEFGGVGAATVLYRSPVTKGATPAETVIGEPEEIGCTIGVEAGNIGFDYNTGRMYCVDYTNGGLGIIDLETGAIDLLGTYTGDIGGAAVTPAMCVTAEGQIVVADMECNLYIVDPDTLYTTRIGSAGHSGWFYAGMTYDYDTGNIYWNPCMSAGTSPLYLVRLDPLEWEPYISATIVDIGDVSSKRGVEMTAMFTIPTNEPETNYIPVEGIEITNGDSVVGLVGGSVQLNTQTVPQRPSVMTRTWTSSDPDVVSVDRFGKLSFQSVGTATITVSVSNRNPEDGGPFTDSITVTVHESAGNLEAFLVYDQEGTGYYDFWISMNDYDLRHATPNESMISIYTIRSGEYYDGYYYAYGSAGEFYRISADNLADYVTLGQVNLDTYNDQVVSMAMDYTTGTMYGLSLSTGSGNGYLLTINLDNGEVTKVAQLDKKVYALAVDANGTLYAAGSQDDNSDAQLFTLNKETAQATYVTTLPDARVVTGENYYGYTKYNPQMTYDFTTNRIYLNATYHTQTWQSYSGMYMIQLSEDGSEPAVANLGGISLLTNSGATIKEGKVFLGLLCAIPEPEELPVGKVNGILLNKNNGRVKLGETMQLTASVRPSNAANGEVTWQSSDPGVATVDDSGLVTAVSTGTAVITVTSVENPDISVTCTVNVVELTGPQPVAYTFSAEENALLTFNPALPSSTVEKVADFPNAANISGLAYGDNCLFYTIKDTGEVFYYDLLTNQSTSLGYLYTYTGISGLAYDQVNNLLYVVGGFYLYQFDVSKLVGGELNMSSGTYLDADYCTLQTVVCVDGSVYYTGASSNDSRVKLIRMEDKYLSSREVLVDGLEISSVAGKSEMSYDSASGLFYMTDAGDRLYTIDMTGTVTPVDILGDGLDINGLAIVTAE